MLPHDLPDWTACHQQARRWVQAGVFEQIAHGLRTVLRLVDGREAQPAATVLDPRTLQSTPESGRAGHDGAKKRNGSKGRSAVDTLGHLLTLKVSAASEQDRARVAELPAKVQEVTGGPVEVAFVDQGYTGEAPAADAQAAGIQLELVKHTEAKRGFVLPRRWVVERTFGRPGRFRRLARDDERHAGRLALAGLPHRAPAQAGA